MDKLKVVIYTGEHKHIGKLFNLVASLWNDELQLDLK